MFTGSYYVAQANNMIGKITGSNYKVDKMVVAVRACLLYTSAAGILKKAGVENVYFLTLSIGQGI